MNGIGSNTIRKSVVVLMQPAASKCFCSLMQFCGVMDSVQYASTGLQVLSVYAMWCIVSCMYAYLHWNKATKKKTIPSIATMAATTITAYLYRPWSKETTLHTSASMLNFVKVVDRSNINCEARL